MKRLILQDIFRYSKSTSIIQSLKAFYHFPGLRFVISLRFCNYYNKWNPLGIMARLYYKKLKVKYGFQIPHTTEIGGGLYLGHFGNVVINSKVILGENVNVAHGVTIGQINIGTKKGYPKIGNRVWIGTNSVIVGNITIEDDVIVAPLSFVNFNVPHNSVVGGNPARILSEKSSEGYINNVFK